MKISFWNKLASYFVDIVLEKRQSEFSGELEVLLRKGRVALCTTNAVYSYEDLYVNYSDSFRQMDWDRLDIDHVLVLGLGFGSIPLLLEKKFGKKFRYTLVEIDPVVVELAEKYALGHLMSDINIVCQDAAIFVANTVEKFDLIAVDLFIDDITPSVFETSDFLMRIHDLLSSNGVLMYNRLTYSKILENRTKQFYINRFQPVFKNAHTIALNGNKMLLNINCLK